MSSRLDEFKDFVKSHPLLKEEVAKKNKTWQSIYESWVLDSDDKNWDKYIKEKKEEDKEVNTTSSNSTEEMIKNFIGYAKKIKPDTITKSIESIQKIVGLLGSFGAGGIIGSASANTQKKTGDPLFDRRFDDWY